MRWKFPLRENSTSEQDWFEETIGKKIKKGLGDTEILQSLRGEKRRDGGFLYRSLAMHSDLAFLPHLAAYYSPSPACQPQPPFSTLLPRPPQSRLQSQPLIRLINLYQPL